MFVKKIKIGNVELKNNIFLVFILWFAGTTIVTQK